MLITYSQFMEWDINLILKGISNMKLAYKTIFINTIISISILLIGELSLYYFLKYKISEEAVEHLQVQQRLIKRKIEAGINVYLFKDNIGETISVEEINTIEYTLPIIKDMEIAESKCDEAEGKEDVFVSKQLVFDIEQNNKNYRISILKTVDEGLSENLVVILFVSSAIMCLVLIIINLLIYNKLFSPVHKLIRDMKFFSIQNLQKINPPKTSTLEFQDLGESISALSKKNIEDYVLMKEFTENIAHEIQTPLAVISSKIEQCMQDENLTEKQANLLGEATNSLNKLFKLNRGLILLSKLENNQFTSVGPVNINTMVKERIVYFSDFIEDRKIKITETYFNEITANIDYSLAEILIDNILKNAIKHNIENGSITIKINKNNLTISNTGEEPTVPTEQFFNRFYSKNTNDSLGLGLSIAKKIADYYHFKLNYSYSTNQHQISINF